MRPVNWDLEVPDAPNTGELTTVTSTLTLDTSIGFTEFVEINVSFLHNSFRDLEIVLESPSGAESKLAVPFDTYSDIITFIDFVPCMARTALGPQDTSAKTLTGSGSCESQTTSGRGRAPEFLEHHCLRTRKQGRPPDN